MDNYTVEMVRAERRVANIDSTKANNRDASGFKKTVKRLAHRGRRRFGKVACRAALSEYLRV